MQESTTGTVQANGLTFQYLEMGQGPLALCLHGFPDHAPSFRFQLPALAAAGYRAVAPYLRGYAPTAVPPNGPYQAAALVQDTVALIDALGQGQQAVVIGHDWGAVAAHGAAIVAPDKISKLVTIAVPHGPKLFEAFVTSQAQQRRSWYMFFFQMPFADDAVALNDFAFIERTWQDWSPGWAYPAEDMEALKATFRQPGVLQAALGYYRHTFNPALQVPELADLQQQLFGATPIHVPSLYFHGQKDGCIGVELSEGMEAHFTKGLQKVLVPDAGHFVHQEKPDLVNQQIVDFLRA